MLKSFTWSAAPCTFTFRSPLGQSFSAKTCRIYQNFRQRLPLMALSWETARTQCGASSYLHFIWLINWNLLQSFHAWPLLVAGCKLASGQRWKSGNKYEYDEETFLPCQRKIFESLSAFNRPLVRSIAGCQALLTAFNGHVFGIALKRTYTHTHIHPHSCICVLPNAQSCHHRAWLSAVYRAWIWWATCYLGLIAFCQAIKCSIIVLLAVIQRAITL